MELEKDLIMKVTPLALKDNIYIIQDYRFTILTPRLIRIEKGTFNDDATLMVINRNTKKVQYTAEFRDNTVIIETKDLQLFYNITRKLEDNYMFFKKDPKHEKRFLNNKDNLKGTMRTLDTFFDGGFCIDKNVTDFKIANLPLSLGVMSRNGVTVISDRDNPILKEDGLIGERSEEEIDSYLFLYLNDYFGCLNDFYLITGKTPLIPRFALGNWWSRYHVYTDSEYLSLLDRFQEEEVPLSIATIDMDWHWTDLESKFHMKELGLTDEKTYGNDSGWTGYSWNTDLFPDYKKTLEEIHERGYHITLNLHPRDGVRWFEDMYPAMAKDMGIDPESKKIIEFDMTDPNYINNYFKDVIHPYEKAGVDFWWIDYQQDRLTKIKNLDPLFPLNHYHFLDNKEHLILSRYCELGAHRYPLGFSGDTKQIFEFLELMPYYTFTATNAGYTWWSHDIGAHHYGEKDDDLYTRWIEFGVFSPINRIHSNSMDVVSKEPWFNKSEVRYITDYYLRLRHRLLPYLYHYSHLTHEENLPLITPLYYQEPKKKEAYLDESTYFFGEMVVSPIITKRKNGYAIKRFYLPKGRFIDIISGRWYKGGKTIEVARDLGEIPVFLRDDAILPLQNDLSNVNNEPKDMEIFVGGTKAKLQLRETIDLPFNTKFSMIKKDEQLYFTSIMETKKDFIRDYKIQFKAIENAKIEVLVNGTIYPYKKRGGMNLMIEVSKIKNMDKLEIILSDIKTQTFKEYLDRYALFILTGEKGINTEKEKIYLDIKNNVQTKKELKEYLSNAKLNKNLKVRLKELSYFE